ncbi:sensor histidine kinase [Alicyclobacillus cycloheptanicus]|uniref:histidine kinase n=1 Tax=Alicyclobacillus cycloheptanicus TaxID=1457 RepID=A0ABT9XIB8_9BACL|nr:sensor histidine kinase [Alicyclobacillus cycloheptanicus]MDQ0190033.1 signal transduction histidine kinase [Alicyclobacillus cycloheptanicus]WDM00065.1 sensor histidine kinase [Alicyclobacillus cycloheptanicus]
MRELRLFFGEIWRTIMFFGIGYGLMMLTVALTFRFVRVPLGNLLYALFLGWVVLIAFLASEFRIRRRFYREACARMDNPSSLTSADTFLAAGTAEQRFFVDLLHRTHDAYRRELGEVTEQKQFYELFTTRFAHQMKTPLTVVQLLEQEMLSAYPSCVALAEFLDSLSEERVRLETTLGIMLGAARLHSFSFDSRMEEIDLVELVRSVVNAHKREWVRRGIYPKITVDQQPVIVRSDRKWLQFVIDQIVCNALQYGRMERTIENGMPSSTFLMQFKSNANNTVLSFTDQGIGIPPRDLPHVFEPFFTGSNGRSHSRATGMGLYLVKEILDRLGHKICIDSTEGQGTTVTVTISRSDYLSAADSLRK